MGPEHVRIAKYVYIYIYIGCMACGILVPQPEIEPMLPAVEVES